MDVLFEDFTRAVNASSGYQLAQTLSPAAPADQLDYLDAIWRSTNAHNVKGDVRRIINACRIRERMSKDEVNGWVDVYAAYWKVVGEIVAASEGTRVSLVCLWMWSQAPHNTTQHDTVQYNTNTLRYNTAPSARYKTTQ